jgi:hypothetical protein
LAKVRFSERYTALSQLLKSVPYERQSDEPLSLHEMKDALKCMGRVGQGEGYPPSGDNHFCVFIDGLDEFAGDQLELIRVLDDFSLSPVVKTCLASRPWNIFRDPYENRFPHLFLEDLTRNDIEVYVRGNVSRWNDVPGIIQNAYRSDELETLVIDIVDRAEGIFLWVYLVVLSVVRGLAEGDSVDVLRQRVGAFPNDLDNFFEAILGRVDRFYRPLTPQLLRLACIYDDDSNARRSSSFIDYWLLINFANALEEPTSIYKMTTRLFSHEEFIEMATAT